MDKHAKQLARLQHELADKRQGTASGRYLADFIFGANDGLVTTFAVVAGAQGAHLAPFTVLIFGLANLLADGLSMGLGNYLGQRSEVDYQRRQRLGEIEEIEKFPEMEKEEVEEIFRRWGFTPPLLQEAARTITADKKRWVDFMMREELGVIEDHPASPARRGLATFVAFAAAGMVPLIPYLLRLSGVAAVQASIVMTATAMFAVGASRSRLTVQKWYWGGLQMLLVGGSAAVAAYAVGFLVERWIS
ncbi:MAG: hypothetical protein G01um101431_925 [Parcubacteria group bacterium Gr01-1014_31]|nr:MAG: hypothetical protein G01um101431_925 [Parcubacteria group bacterium Gr01-1014_31]